MMTSLAGIDDSKVRVASGEQPYAFETSDHTTVLGPACRYGTRYLQQLRTEGRYAESFEEAVRFAGSKGLTIIGVWFVKAA